MTREEFYLLTSDDAFEMLDDLEKEKFSLERILKIASSGAETRERHIEELNKKIKVLEKANDCTCQSNKQLNEENKRLKDLISPVAHLDRVVFPDRQSMMDAMQQTAKELEEARMDLLAKDDELVSTRIDLAEAKKAKDNLFKEVHRHCEIKDQMEEDLGLLKDVVKLLVKEWKSRE